MNKQELQNKIEDLEKQLAEVKEQVNSVGIERIKKGIRQMPIRGDWYWYVDSYGIVTQAKWRDKEADLFRFNTGNCFKTEKEAEDYKENLLTKQALKDLALELNNGVEIDWGKCNPKYFICLSKAGEFLDQCYNIYDNCNTSLYCLDENFLQLAKDRIGEEKLIKLIKSGV